jgi:hypothetical protein
MLSRTSLGCRCPWRCWQHCGCSLRYTTPTNQRGEFRTVSAEGASYILHYAYSQMEDVAAKAHSVLCPQEYVDIARQGNYSKVWGSVCWVGVLLHA